MTSKVFSSRILLLSLLWLLVTTGTSLCSARPADGQSKPPSSAPPAATDFTGTWSGTFFSKHANVAPFTMTVVINADSHGHLVGASTLSSDCLKNVRLEVTVKGAQITLAGSDNEGDNIMVRGIVDGAGTMLKANYILNGSASGRCETDDGTGNLAKR
ncbi:MAG: hypothetical protein LAO23_13645 [Acidobacteriia bacterium]|nr:hypothetical protein [Terriglobia bacterium]